MIVFTLFYAPVLLWFLLDPHLGISLVFLWWLKIHVLVQLAFTIGIHWYEGAAIAGRASDRLLYFVVVSVLIGVGSFVIGRHIHWAMYEPGELIYRLFMSFYGLVFPAYVWLCMIPTWRMPAAPTRRMWVVFGGVVVVAAPFYWAGFIGGRMIWVVPGVVIVLLARLAVQKDRTAPKIG